MNRREAHSGLEFELQRRLDDAVSTSLAHRDGTQLSNYLGGLIDGLAASLGCLHATNAAHELIAARRRVFNHPDAVVDAEVVMDA